MEIYVLGSSSSGNSTLIRTESTAILVDVGFSCRYTTKALKNIGTDPKDIDAVLITHEHTDHIRGAGPFFRKYRIPFLMNKPTYQSSNLEIVPAFFENFQEFRIKDLRITPITVNHDSSNPVGYLIEGEKKVGVATDLGSIDERLKAYFKGLDAYVFESNYDEEMLANGSYPVFLKRRIAGNYGHLSNEECGKTLKEMSDGADVFLAHMSENNNTPEKARDSAEGILGSEFTIHLTHPKRGSEKVRV
ncbi:MAG: MBL fold metallo-hydrolase [Euryarchaeota archaeon]|nr:MBL fold metallo-hydrolase [Euryarchaeota archaeon]